MNQIIFNSQLAAEVEFNFVYSSLLANILTAIYKKNYGKIVYVYFIF
jgi:hypothetical protein